MSLENYESKLQNGYYRVRKAWEDEKSQIGQYRLLNSAVKKADENPGYSVFTPAGIAIYPEDEAETTADEAVATVGASGDEGQTNTQSEDENGLEANLRISDNYEIEEDGTETVSEVETVTDVEPTTTDEEIAAEWGESVNDEETVNDTEPVSDEDTLSDDDLAAQTEALGEDEYPNDGNTEPVLYAKANTLLNIRAGNSLDAEKVALIRKGEIAEVLEVCENGWYRIKSEKAECGYAYVCNTIGTYFSVGRSLYTVQPADSLWKIAEKELGSGTKYTEIKTANGLTSNVIRVGMVLLIP